MAITNTVQTPFALTSVRPASGFGMPNGGQSCFGVLADTRTPSITTGLIVSMTTGSVVVDRKDRVAKGHVAVAAYLPGHPAWSPPIC